MANIRNQLKYPLTSDLMDYYWEILKSEWNPCFWNKMDEQRAILLRKMNQFKKRQILWLLWSVIVNIEYLPAQNV